MNELPDTLPREYIIKAIHAYDSGFSHRFKEARLYELEFQGRRYPSKAIAGIAATLLTAKRLPLRISPAVSVRNALDY